MLPGKIKTALKYLPQLLLLRFGGQFRIAGVRVVAPFLDQKRAEALRAKVGASLSLLQNYSPKHHRRVERFIPNVLILGGHSYRAVYTADLKLCDVSREFALSESTSPERLALTLVHEAAHGYIHSRGVLYAEDRRARIERICVKAEIAFADRIPQGHALVAEAKQCLEYGPDYWTDKSFLRREVEGLTKAGMPQFLIRAFARRRSRRVRTGRGEVAQPIAPLNGSPATPAASSGVTEGPPSVS